MSAWDDISRLMVEHSDRARLAGADRRSLKRVPTLRAARACHAKRLRLDAALTQSTTSAGGDAEYRFLSSVRSESLVVLGFGPGGPEGPEGPFRFLSSVR